VVSANEPAPGWQARKQHTEILLKLFDADPWPDVAPPAVQPASGG
jgi:hypothetical protein